MRSSTIRGACLFLPLTLFAWGCGETPTSPTNTTGTTAPTISETFSDTLVQGGSNTHTLHAAAGSVTTQVLGIGPVSTLVIGVKIGTWSNGVCTAVVTSETATTGTLLLGTATSSIDLCMSVYDVGNIAEGASATYSIQVVHQ
jgi:hypothetical protein